MSIDTLHLARISDLLELASIEDRCTAIKQNLSSPFMTGVSEKERKAKAEVYEALMKRRNVLLDRIWPGVYPEPEPDEEP